MMRGARSRANSWEGILAKGERILWQGQPSQKLSARPGEILESLFGLVFAGFSIIWMAKVGGMRVGPSWMFGLPFLAVGLYQIFGKYLWTSYQRGHTWYTLSDRAAYIAKDSPIGGRTIKSYQIRHDMELDLSPGSLSSIYFAEEPYRVNGRTRTARVGFENLPDGRDVFDMMIDIRKGLR